MPVQKNQDVAAVAAVQNIGEVVARQKVSEVSTHTSRRRPAQVPVFDLITTIMKNQKTWQPSTLTIADPTQGGICSYAVIITVFACGVMRTLARSRLPQRCQRCFEHIPIGSGVRQFTEGWCHMWCDKQRVEWKVFLPGQHLE